MCWCGVLSKFNWFVKLLYTCRNKCAQRNSSSRGWKDKKKKYFITVFSLAISHTHAQNGKRIGNFRFQIGQRHHTYSCTRCFQIVVSSHRTGRMEAVGPELVTSHPCDFFHCKYRRIIRLWDEKTASPRWFVRRGHVTDVSLQLRHFVVALRVEYGHVPNECRVHFL